jgi:NADH-quinone oxidoreductase subunit N
MLGAFATVSLVSGTGEEARSLEDYRGLFFTRPWLAACFTAIMLSLAGIPLTAGFLGKLYVISAGASQGSWALLIILIASSTVGLFYYLKVVAIMFSTRKEAPGWGRPRQKSFPAGITVAVLFILLVVVGVYPASLLHLIEGMMTMLH